MLDEGPFRKARVRGLGKETTVMVMYPYGLTANAPEGSLCLSWQVSGQESDRAALVDYPQIRPKDLEPGEVILSNYLTGAKVKMSANGNIDVSTSSDVTISAANLTVSADVFVIGNVAVTGLSVMHNGTNIGDTHIHSQGNDSNGDAEVDTGTPHS